MINQPTNDDERVRRVIEEIDLEAASTARMLALLIIAGIFLFGVAACGCVAHLLSK